VIDFFPVPTSEILFTQRCNMACLYCFEVEKKNTSMQKEDLLDFVKNLPSLSISLFGGEPFMDIDLFINLYDAIESKDMNEAQKKKILNSITIGSNLITNGTLIESHIDFIKKYKITVQISLDGPKEVNNLNRVYHNGNGTYEDIMKGIEFCIQNDIPWSFHGALSKNYFKYLPEIFDLFWDLAKKMSKDDINEAIKIHSQNTFQIILEEEYTDDDIDIFLQKQASVFDKISNLSEINEAQRIKLFHAWFCRKGAVCGAGHTFFSVDSDLNVHTCHRTATQPNKDDFRLVDLKDRSTFKYKVFNSYIALAKDAEMYSAILNIDKSWSGTHFQQNWCPAANNVESGTVFYQNAKYNLMIAEYGRFITELFDYAKIPLPKLGN